MNSREASLRLIIQKENPVNLKAGFGSRKPIPAGYNQSIPGVLVMFVLMNLLIFGGTSVASERREGVMRRFMVHPVSKSELVFGKIAGLLGLGLVQIVYMLLVSMLLMKFRIGAQFLPVLVVLITYAWAAGSFGVLIGSITSRDDKIVGIWRSFQHDYGRARRLLVGRSRLSPTKSACSATSRRPRGPWTRCTNSSALEEAGLRLLRRSRSSRPLQRGRKRVGRSDFSAPD